MSVTRLLRAWGFEGCAASVDHIPVLLVPAPVVYLILQKQWQCVAVLTRWHQAFRYRRSSAATGFALGPLVGYPPTGASIWESTGKQDFPLEMIEISSERCRDISNYLKESAISLIANHECHDTEDAEKEALETHVRCLDAWSQHLSNTAINRLYGKWKHASEKIIECIRLASYLKNHKKLFEVIRRSMRIALPAGLLPESFGRGLKPISDTLLRRYELSLDVSLMLWQRERSRLEFATFAASDSSPGVGYEWVWSEYIEAWGSKPSHASGNPSTQLRPRRMQLQKRCNLQM